jgi:hypothetical protein
MPSTLKWVGLKTADKNMKTVKTLQGRRKRFFLWVAVLAAISFAGLFNATSSSTTHAVTSVPTLMNFQGRLTNSAGNILANGTYNMKFRIYNAVTSGTLQWNEDRLVSAGQGVTVTNGLFSVQLGSVSSLPASIFTSNSLYFEIELPTPATATSSSPSWTEGAMSPRNQLSTSAYAYNAETLDGIDSASFAQLGSANAFTAANSVNVASANAFQVKSGATNLLNIDSTNSIISIGASDATGAVLLLDSKTTSGDPTGASAVNGAMYYNTVNDRFRCFEAGSWGDCNTAFGLQDVYDNEFTTPVGITTTSAAKTLLFKAGATFDAAALFDIQRASGVSLFTADSANDRVYIGDSVADAAGTVLILDTKNTTGDPTGVNGAMYYNSFYQKFRCFEGSVWQNCSASPQINSSTATQAVTAGTDTYLTGSSINLPPGGMQGPTGTNQDGTLITWRIYMTKTAAGLAASTFNIRFGTAGTTADTARCTAFGTGTPTAAIDGATVTITAYATAGGATTTLNCSGTLTHQLPATGFANTPMTQAYSTAASFSTTTVGTKAGISFNAGTSSIITIQKVEVTAVNL